MAYADKGVLDDAALPGQLGRVGHAHERTAAAFGRVGAAGLGRIRSLGKDLDRPGLPEALPVGHDLDKHRLAGQGAGNKGDGLVRGAGRYAPAVGAQRSYGQFAACLHRSPPPSLSLPESG